MAKRLPLIKGEVPPKQKDNPAAYRRWHRHRSPGQAKKDRLQNQAYKLAERWLRETYPKQFHAFYVAARYKLEREEKS